MLSDIAWMILPRSSWRAKKVMHANVQTRISIWLDQYWRQLTDWGACLSHKFLFFLLAPFKIRIPPVSPFVTIDRLIQLRILRGIESAFRNFPPSQLIIRQRRRGTRCNSSVARHLRVVTLRRSTSRLDFLDRHFVDNWLCLIQGHLIVFNVTRGISQTQTAGDQSL